MTGLTKRQLLTRIAEAHQRVSAEIAGNRSGMFGRGMSTEGYAGGYRDALNDVEALLRHGHPSDTRGYWKHKTNDILEK